MKKFNKTQIALLRAIFSGDQDNVDSIADHMEKSEILEILEKADEISLDIYKERLHLLALPYKALEK